MDQYPATEEDEYLRWKRDFAATPRGSDFLARYEQECRYVAKQEVASLVDEMRTVLERKATDAHRQADLVRLLRQEFEEISLYIRQTRNEIASLHPDDAGANWLETARGELDAIVTATEQATYDILGAAEEVQRLVGTLPTEGAAAPVRAALEAQVIAILTACSFQDITGQRTTKVVNALRFLEARVNSMVQIWGAGDRAAAADLLPTDTRPDAHLLNGPALTGGISQNDVDALMGSALAASPTGAVTSSSQCDIDALFD